MNLRDLHYLVALADHRHFSRAAEACHVSQPTLSTQLKKLEDELDVQLVERNSRQVLLTSVGEAVAARARVVLQEADNLRELARLSKEPHAGTLTLGVFPTLGPYWLPHVVPRIVSKFPKLRLHLVEEKTEVLIEQLQQGKIDAAVLAEPIEASFKNTKLFDESFILALPSEHPLARKKRIEVMDLADESLMLLSEGHCMRDQALSVCTLSGARENQNFRATSLETLRQMVAAGVGATLLPSLATIPPVPPNPAIALVRFSAPQPLRSIGLYWRESSARESFFKTLAPFLGAVPEDALVDS